MRASPKWTSASTRSARPARRGQDSRRTLPDRARTASASAWVRKAASRRSLSATGAHWASTQASRSVARLPAERPAYRRAWDSTGNRATFVVRRFCRIRCSRLPSPGDHHETISSRLLAAHFRDAGGVYALRHAKHNGSGRVTRVSGHAEGAVRKPAVPIVDAGRNQKSGNRQTRTVGTRGRPRAGWARLRQYLRLRLPITRLHHRKQLRSPEKPASEPTAQRARGFAECVL